MTDKSAGTDHDEGDIPVSNERLEECLVSAKRWTRELPGYADRNQNRADFWAILAGILAVITGLAVFPVLGEGSPWGAKLVVSIVGLASGISALVPRVKNYGEQAGSARVLAAQYGSVYGRLLDLTKCDPIPQHAARIVMLEFQSTNEKKDALRGITRYKGDKGHKGDKPNDVDKRDEVDKPKEVDKPSQIAADEAETGGEGLVGDGDGRSGTGGATGGGETAANQSDKQTV